VIKGMPSGAVISIPNELSRIRAARRSGFSSLNDSGMYMANVHGGSGRVRIAYLL